MRLSPMISLSLILVLHILQMSSQADPHSDPRRQDLFFDEKLRMREVQERMWFYEVSLVYKI